MKVLVTGATGLVGTALVKSLAHDGHLVCRLLRRESVTGAKGARPKSAKKAEAATAAGLEGRVFDVAWDPEASAAHAIGDPQGHTVGADAVVNLAGASIADGKWTTQRKMQLRSSRIKTTRSLLTALQKAGLSPKVLVSASAIGIFGDRGDEVLTEESEAGRGFLAGLATKWEAEARAAESMGMRVVCAPVRRPVRNSDMSATTLSKVAQDASPSSSTIRASGTCAATYRPCDKGKATLLSE